MPFEIVKPSAVPYIKTLLYGDPKIGKTFLIGTSPVKTLVLDFEGGSVSLPVNENIDVIRIDELKVFDEVFEWLASDDNLRGYELLAIDSLSEINQRIFLELLEQEAVKHSRRDLNRAEIQDYNIQLIATSRLIRAFMDLPMHVIMTAHKASKITKEKGLVYYPMLSPTKMPDIAKGIVNEVVYLAEDVEGIRYLLLQGYGEYGVRCRVREGIEVPNEIENPTMETYLKAIRGEGATFSQKPPVFKGDTPVDMEEEIVKAESVKTEKKGK